jgi:hypothetical protein
MRPHRLELAGGVRLVKPREAVRGKAAVRSLDDTAEIGAVRPHLHQLGVSLRRHA